MTININVDTIGGIGEWTKSRGGLYCSPMGTREAVSGSSEDWSQMVKYTRTNLELPKTNISLAASEDRMTCTIPGTYFIACTGSGVEGFGTIRMSYAVFRNGTTQVTPRGTFTQDYNANHRATATQGFVTLAVDDYLEVFEQNELNTDNVGFRHFTVSYWKM